MISRQTSAHCDECNRQRLFVSDHRPPNHILHLLISLLSLGVWLPVWLAISLAASAGTLRCSICDEVIPRDGLTTWIGAFAMSIAAAMIYLPMFWFCGHRAFFF